MFHHPLRVLCLLACVAGWSIQAAGQTVWRCGDTYSQKPCPGGKAVDANDTRTAGQKSQTDQAVRRDAKAAEALEKARLKEEAIPAQVISPPAKVQAAYPKHVSAPTLKKPEEFRAVAPRKPGEVDKKKKKKAKKKDA